MHFHVTENREDEEAPFAFAATYTSPPPNREALDLFRALSADSVGVASGLSALAEAERVSGLSRALRLA